MSNKIGMSSLKVGEWVQFTTDKDPASFTENQKKIYQDNNFYLVLTREDHLFDGCRCYLVDKNGETHDYCPRMYDLGYTRLLENTVTVVPAEEVKAVYGQERVQAIYQACQNHLDKMSKYFSQYAAKKLDVSSYLESSATEQTEVAKLKK